MIPDRAFRKVLRPILLKLIIFFLGFAVLELNDREVVESIKRTKQNFFNKYSVYQISNYYS